MNTPSCSQTSLTLLGRLRHDPLDQSAWSQLVERYGPCIFSWCRRGGLQEADAEDVTQMVLIRLVERMRTFNYDPAKSFRGWLRTLTKHAWSDFVEARQRGGRGRGGDDSVLLTTPAREDLIARLEEQFDREMLEEATARVRLRIETKTWEAFQLLVVERLSGVEAARRLNRSVAAVFKAKTRVQGMLRAEIARLEGVAS